MSLITDTLNKMKKEQGREENDDKMMAPPALRNAVVNTKKYKEFVKNAEIKDINGNKAPLKGFVIVSIILISVICIATIYFLNSENEELAKQAGIVSNSQPANVANNNTGKSLGKPYIPQEKSLSNSANNGTLKETSGQNINKSENKQLLNVSQNRQVQSSMSAMPDSAKISNHKNENTPLNQGPVNLIPANQLFVITPTSSNNAVDNTSKQEILKKEDDAKNNKKAGFTEISPEDAKKAYEYTQKQVEVEQARALSNAKAIKENLASTQQQIPLNKGSVQDYTAKTEITEVKAIKTKEPAGTVSASTVSLYNQYVTTGNKAKNEGSYEKAIEYYTNALALNKNDVLAANIANMYLELKNPNMVFQVVVKNGMTDAKLISALIVRMVNSKYFLESNKLLQYANTLEKSSYTLFANGYYAQSQEQYEIAIKFYKDAIQVDPSDVRSAYYAALCFEEQGKNSDAVEMYKYIVDNKATPENMKKQAVSRITKLQ